MGGRPSPLTAIEAHRLPALLPQTIQLRQGNFILVPFTLWSPSAASILRTLALSLPGQTIYAVTSYAANTGEADTPSPAMQSALRAFQQELPPRIRTLLVPDTVLQAFHADAFPGAIAIRDGRVLADQPLAGEGSIRSLLFSLGAAR